MECKVLRQIRTIPVALLLLVFCFAAAPVTARADEPEFDALANYIKQNYQGKRVSIPFLGLGRFLVKVIRPAGVKSFKLAVFENVQLNHSSAVSSAKHPLNLMMREVLSPEWQPLIRVRTREGQQMHVYAREAGKDIKLLIASIDNEEAFVARVKFNPQSLAKWMQNPQIMGLSLK
jgi:hypothetical protein